MIAMWGSGSFSQASPGPLCTLNGMVQERDRDREFIQEEEEMAAVVKARTEGILSKGEGAVGF